MLLKRLFLGTRLDAERKADEELAKERARAEAEAKVRERIAQFRSARMQSLVDKVEADAADLGSVAPPEGEDDGSLEGE